MANTAESVRSPSPPGITTPVWCSQVAPSDAPAQSSDEILAQAGAPSSPLDLANSGRLDTTDDVIIDLFGFHLDQHGPGEHGVIVHANAR